MKHFFFALVILTITPSSFAKSVSCGKAPKVISKATKSEAAHFITWLQHSKDDDIKLLAKYPEEMNIYIADIGNDGHPKYVVADIQGSGGYLFLNVFEKIGNEYHKIANAPPAPAEFADRDGGWYEHGFYNSQKKSELLVEICGTTYMNFFGPESGTNVAYVWKNGKTERACNENWAGYQTGLFQSAYDQKKFDHASNNLKEFYTSCKASLSAEMRLRILSNLTVSLAHLHDSAACVAYVKEAKATSGFEASAQKSAILHNETLCAASSQAAAFDFKNAEEIVKAGLNDAIVAATVPNLEFSQNSFDTRAQKWLEQGAISKDTKRDSHRRFNLRDEVRKNLTGPGPMSRH